MLNKNLKLNLAIITTLLLVSFLAMTPTQAGVPVSDLAVQFERNPLFSESNFLPGDAVTRWIKVGNNTGSSQKVATEAINVTDPNSLASSFNLQIKEGAVVLFNNTLAAFLADMKPFCLI